MHSVLLVLFYSKISKLTVENCNCLFTLIGTIASFSTINFIIPLPDTGTALFFQPNLLTDFTRRGPYNIVLLARHLDQLIQIPHLDQTDTLPSVERVERLDFPVKSPYQKVHDEVKALMPLAKSVGSSTDSESSQPIHVV